MFKENMSQTQQKGSGCLVKLTNRHTQHSKTAPTQYETHETRSRIAGKHIK